MDDYVLVPRYTAQIALESLAFHLALSGGNIDNPFQYEREKALDSLRTAMNRVPVAPKSGWFLDDAKINGVQQTSILDVIKRCKQAHFTNIRIRINGKWEEPEADWIKHLVRAKADPVDEKIATAIKSIAESQDERERRMARGTMEKD